MQEEAKLVLASNLQLEMLAKEFDTITEEPLTSD